MLTVSLHCIRISAPHGLYPQEHLIGNSFEIDVDVCMPVTAGAPLPFVDYVMLRDTVAQIFEQEGQLLETFVQQIHTALKTNIPNSDKIKVVVRKLNPPMAGFVQYAQVCYEG